MQSLATRYRPSKFETVLGQKSVIKILEQQLNTKQFTNCYLFAGPSGDGKTTLSRIFANRINEDKGSPIEIDGASHNGVQDIRDIIADAESRSIDSEYKIFIIDECHAITTQGWQAFLKCIEEPPHYTIFIFCTTNPEKIPATILNRVMRLNLTKVPTDLIRTRLTQICEFEEFTNYETSCDYIAKLSNGGVRDAIASLEKCANYSKDLSIDNVLECLGDLSYDTLFDLTGALYNGDEGSVLQTIEDYYNSGKDLKQLIEKYLEFSLDLTKYCIFKNMDLVKIPLNLQTRCEAFSKVPDVLNWINSLVEKVLNIKNIIKGDVNNKTTIEAMLIAISRGE